MDTLFYPSGLYRPDVYTTLQQVMASGISDLKIDTLGFRRIYWNDALGRVSHWHTVYGFLPGSPPAADIHRQSYVYDSLGQLRRWERWSGCYVPPDSSSPSSGVIYPCATLVSAVNYTYDIRGNRTDNGGTYSAGNRISQFKGYLFEHDADGNITRKYKPDISVDIRYTWNAVNQLIEVRNMLTNVQIRYHYDAEGRLQGRQDRVNSVLGPITYFITDDTHILAVLDSGFKRQVEYVYEPGIDRPLAMITGTMTADSIRYFVLDELGNVIGLHDGVDKVVQQVTYDPWGVPTITGAAPNTLLWKGLLWESGPAIGGAGLYYMRARWYDPELGRFLSEDPIGVAGGLNLYTFAQNDPVNGIDPKGLCSFRLRSDGPNTLRDAPKDAQLGVGNGRFYSCGDTGPWGLWEESKYQSNLITYFGEIVSPVTTDPQGIHLGRLPGGTSLGSIANISMTVGQNGAAVGAMLDGMGNVMVGVKGDIRFHIPSYPDVWVNRIELNLGNGNFSASGFVRLPLAPRITTFGNYLSGLISFRMFGITYRFSSN